MDKFLQQFKDNLENRPASEFDQQDWAEMQQRLEQQNAPKPINYWTWAAVALLLLMVGSNSLILQQLNEANEKINQLENSIDTLVQTKVVFRTDTIYQLIESSNIGDNEASLASSNTKNNRQVNEDDLFYKKLIINQLRYNSFLNFITQKQLFSSFTPSTPNTIFKSNELQNLPLIGSFYSTPINNSPFGQQRILAEKQMDSVEKEEEKTIAFSVLNPIEAKITAALTTPIRVLPPVPEIAFVPLKRKKNFGQLLYPMRPKGIVVGPNYAWGRSLADYHRDQKMRQWELKTQIKFSPAFHLWIAGSYLSLDYEADRMGAEFGVPEVIPSTDNFVFDEVNIDQRVVSVSTGLLYHFRATKKWQPFIGIGYGIGSTTKNMLRYRFETSDTINPMVFEVETNENVNNLSFGLFKGGVVYQLNDHLSFQLAGRYQHRAKSSNQQLPNILMGNLGASFSF